MTSSSYISVQTQAINTAAEYAALSRCDTHFDNGAITCFIGSVRGGEVLAMTLEHYPQMTEQKLQEIAANAASRWQLAALRVVHRIGRLLPGEEIVFVGVQSRHRADSAAACAYITDYLKTEAPFWKKEETAAGSRWVSARGEDQEARRRWQQQ